MAAECARCRFPAGAWQGPPTYAFVVRLGLHVPDAAQQAEAHAAGGALLGVSAYCGRCRQVCWVTRSTDAQEALERHSMAEAAARALLAYAGTAA